MKHLFAALLICLSFSVHAQQNHFIYIQADNRQPFYVKLDKQILSSSASGYLIIPKLHDGSYDLAIGFPRNEWPEQKVTCDVDTKDAGYLLKNFGEKGWGLFNLQTMALLMATTGQGADSAAVAAKNDPFSNALANVVNDPAIKNIEVPKEDTVAVEVTAPVKKTPVKKTDKPVAKSKDNAKKDVVKKDVVKKETPKKDGISRIVATTNSAQVKRVYIDRSNGEADTVRIIFPVETTVAKKVSDSSITTVTTVAKHDATKKPAKAKAIAKADIKKKPTIVDTTVVAIAEPVKTDSSFDFLKAFRDYYEKSNKKDSAKTIAAVKKPAKTKPSKKDIAKADKKPVKPKDIIVKNDSTAVAKADTMKFDVTYSNINNAEKGDTTATNPVQANTEPAKEVVANVVVDTARTIQPEINTVIASIDTTNNIAKVEENKLIPKTDTLAQVIVQPKEDVKPVDTVAVVNVEKRLEPTPEEVRKAMEKQQLTQPETNTVKTDVQPEVKQPKVEDSVKKEVKPEVEVVKNNTPVAIVPCKYTADPDEFLNLKKKMSKGKSDNEMLFYAHQLFQKRCVTTKQIERLAVMFNNDMAKYNLFDDAYHYCADRENFASLQSMLSDEYYIKRFKAILP